MLTSRRHRPLLTLLAVALCALVAAPADARMVSERISKNVCLTTGGGRFVDIPGFPGERIDRRLLTDLRFLEQRYKIFVTDGLSEDPVHAANGEHPIGLAADLVPNTAAGGTWNDIDRLAAWAEPEQNEPRAPFRWVGYDGDENHGRGNHLHLSWDHSLTKPGIPAATVNTIFCPTVATTPVPTPPVAPPTGATEPTGNDGGRGGRGHQPDNDTSPTGGGGGGGGGGASSSPAGGVRNGGRSSSGSGGVAGRVTTAPPVIETAGVGYNDR
jgi:hypothetical protein